MHINAGAVALALVLGKRTGWLENPGKPHNLWFVVLVYSFVVILVLTLIVKALVGFRAAPDDE